MLFIIPLFLLVQPDPSLTQELDPQIHTYYQNLEEEHVAPESLWSLLQIYLENDSFRDRFFEIGDSYEMEWISLLEQTHSSPNSFYRLALQFHKLAVQFSDEYLHLYMQLHVFPEEERRSYFKDFYEQTETEELLWSLNRKIVEGEKVEPEDLLQTGWNFAAFLILTYPDNVHLEESVFYEALSDELSRIADGSLLTSEPEKDFLYATLFEALYKQKRYRAIRRYYEELNDLDYLPNISGKRNLYWRMDYVFYTSGHPDLSLNIQRNHTLPLSEMLEDPASLNAVRATHGGYLYVLGQFTEARDIYQTALADSVHLTSSIRTRLLNNLSLVHYKLGENNQYIETQLRALDFACQQEDYSHQLNIYRNLHVYYRNNGNRELALQYMAEARRIAELSENRRELASIIISESVYYNNFLDDQEQTFTLLNEAENLLENASDLRLKIRVLYERANLYKKMEEYDKSHDLYQEVKQIGRENENKKVLLEVLVDLADVELLMGNSAEATRYIQTFNTHDISIVDFFVLVNARRIEAEIAFQNQNYAEGERLISRVYDQVLERARNTSDLESGYWHTETSYLNLFRLYADLLLEQDRFGDMLNVLDQYKTINDASLVDNPLIRADLYSEEELAENRRITRELHDLRKQLLASDDENRLLLRNEISSLSARKEQLTNRSMPKELFHNMPLWALQTHLSRGETILHVTHLLDHLYLFLISDKEVRTKIIHFGSSEKQLFERAIAGLTSGNTNLLDLYQVYQFLDLEALLSDTRSLIIFPDSYLYQLPLDVLPVRKPLHTDSYGAAEYLIEHMEVSYLNNLQDFTRKEPVANYQRDFTGIGISEFPSSGTEFVSLPKATDEIKAITQTLDRVDQTLSLLGSDGTPSAFREYASDSKILHLASHSKISESDPLFSTLYLYPEEDSGNQSGQLYAYQLFDMNLTNELIMLNSCESGSGGYFQGAGVMGISRALRYAGARSLILNSWSVNDHFASDFAVRFYSYLNRGDTKSGSLREAKIEFLMNRNANPHYWGAYMLNGNPRPIVEKAGTRASLVFLILLFAGAVLLSLSRR